MSLLKDFETIYQQNYRIVHGVALKMLGQTGEVADIVQEVFVDFHKHITNGKKVENIKSWLYRTTCNKSIDLLRKRKKIVKVDDIKLLERLVDESQETDEKKQLIQRAISQLKPKDKALVVLYSEGLSYKEIAEVTDTRQSSVGKLLSRALDKLGEKLKTKQHELY